MIDPPLESDATPVLADWLELVTILSHTKIGHIGEVLNSADIGEDAEMEDIAAHDAARDSLAEAMCEEFRTRHSVLGADAYPFKISANGETLRLLSNHTYGHLTYLSCLLISQSWNR